MDQTIDVPVVDGADPVAATAAGQMRTDAAQIETLENQAAQLAATVLARQGQHPANAAGNPTGASPAQPADQIEPGTHEPGSVEQYGSLGH